MGQFGALIASGASSPGETWRPDRPAVGATEAAAATDTVDGTPAQGPPPGVQRDLVAVQDRLAVAGHPRAVRTVGDGVRSLSPLAARWRLGQDPGSVERYCGCRWDPGLGSVDRLHRLPGAPARCRSPQKGAASAPAVPESLVSVEPDDHGLGRSRGGLTSKVHLAVTASMHVLAVIVTAGQRGDAPQFLPLMQRIRVGARPVDAHAPDLTTYWPTGRIPHARSALTCAAAASRTRSRRSRTRPDTASDAVRPADDLPASTRSDTKPGTRSSAGLGC